MILIDQAKIKAVRDYLQSEFSDYQIDDTEDFERVSQKFRVYNDTEIYIVKFQRSFFDDTPDIKKELQNKRLSKFMRNNSGDEVLVTKEGLSLVAPVNELIYQ